MCLYYVQDDNWFTCLRINSNVQGDFLQWWDARRKKKGGDKVQDTPTSGVSSHSGAVQTAGCTVLKYGGVQCFQSGLVQTQGCNSDGRRHRYREGHHRGAAGAGWVRPRCWWDSLALRTEPSELRHTNRGLPGTSVFSKYTLWFLQYQSYWQVLTLTELSE